MKEAFILKSSKNPKVDADYDAYCLPFKGNNLIGAHMMGINDFEKPERIYFVADFESIPEYDFPSTDMTFPVMSKRMLKALLDVGNFRHQTIPVTMVDDSYLDDQFDSKGRLKPDVPYNDDYIAVQLKEYANVFDYKKSLYEKDLVFPDEVGIVHRLVLMEPPVGFTPIFRIKEVMKLLFINSEAKVFLEKMQIKGCIFEPVEVSG